MAIGDIFLKSVVIISMCFNQTKCPSSLPTYFVNAITHLLLCPCYYSLPIMPAYSFFKINMLYMGVNSTCITILLWPYHPLLE